MKIALYARVSRDDLHCENQKKILLEWAQRNGLAEADFQYFQEEESTRKTRPVKDSIIKGFRAGEFSGVVVTRIDRFARSLQELVMDVEGIINAGGRFVAIMNGFDFDKTRYNASQQLMLNIFASFAQFEREIIRERTIEGLARARAEGKKLGRPRKRLRSSITLPNTNL
jgi:DNA invertase Pin-like site-specific DNA recombinase